MKFFIRNFRAVAITQHLQLLAYITPPLKLHNNGPINVNVKRCRCPCSLFVSSIVFNDCFQSVRHRTGKILKCWQRNWFLCFTETVLQCL